MAFSCCYHYYHFRFLFNWLFLGFSRLGPVHKRGFYRPDALPSIKPTVSKENMEEKHKIKLEIRI